MYHDHVVYVNFFTSNSYGLGRTWTRPGVTSATPGADSTIGSNTIVSSW